MYIHIPGSSRYGKNLCLLVDFFGEKGTSFTFIYIGGVRWGGVG